MHASIYVRVFKCAFANRICVCVCARVLQAHIYVCVINNYDLVENIYRIHTSYNTFLYVYEYACTCM